MDPSLEMQALQERVDALDRLVQVSLVMNSTLELGPLLHYIMISAAEITNAQTGSILLIDENTDELHFVATTDPDAGALKGIVVPLDASIAGTIVRENRAVVIDDTSDDPRHYRHIDDELNFETRSVLGVPMRIKERVVGVLEVINKLEGRFNEADVRHTTILASQAAVAIENAKLIEDIQRANRDLQQLNKLKSDFIAIASHELRTPLGVVLGYASFLQEEAEGASSDHVSRLLDSAMQLRNIIEDMTNLRYVQLTDSEINLETVALADIVDAAANDTQALVDAKNQTLLVDHGDPQTMVEADHHLVTMALTNVLNNAVKFTDQGGVIQVSVERRPRYMLVSVQDNGIGLAPEDTSRIFDQFYQVEDPLTRRHNGIGLGLAIARAIIQKHGGRIWAESPGQGYGSTFYMTIPLARED